MTLEIYTLNESVEKAVMDEIHSCYCVGPQNGEPLCPCRMRSVIVRDGRYIQPEQDLGPVVNNES